MRISFKALVLCLALMQGLAGCSLFLLGSGAAVAGLSLADRRTTVSQALDEKLEIQIKGEIGRQLNARYAGRREYIDLSVVSYNQQVLLLGSVPNESDKAFAAQIASSQKGVKRVYNYMMTNSESGFVDFAKDGWITSKVRAGLISPTGFSPNHVKVVTYAGVTYAMGMLTHSEQVQAARQISTIAGVRKLVTLFEPFGGPM